MKEDIGGSLKNKIRATVVGANADRTNVHTLYLSFLLHRQDFRNQNLHPKRRLKSPKTLKMSLKKSYICIFFHSFWKNLHLTENFYTDMSVVSVTNKRYAPSGSKSWCTKSLSQWTMYHLVDLRQASFRNSVLGFVGRGWKTATQTQTLHQNINS